jgi:hypothetical protein
LINANEASRLMSDADTKIATYAAAVTAIVSRLAPVLAIIQQAAAAESELARLWDQIADIVWATNATEMYQLLVGQRGWTPQRYERFLADTWHRLLLAD